MSNYFYHYPSALYQSKLVTDLLVRTKIKDSWLSDPRLYYQYRYKDGDKPEHLAQKYYGDEELHWIILFTNNIFDPWFELPMKEDTFKKYIEDKYKELGAVVNKTGLEYALSTPDPVHRYQKVIKTKNSEGTVINSYTIDKKSYDALVAKETYSTGPQYTIQITTEQGSDVISIKDPKNVNEGDLIKSGEVIPVGTTILRKLSSYVYVISNLAMTSTVESPANITSIAGDSIVYEITRRYPQMTIYEREEELNEAKRDIRILNKSYVGQARAEFLKLLAQY